MMRILLIALTALLLVPGLARAGRISVGWYSQQVGPARAEIGASIAVSSSRAGMPARAGSPGAGPSTAPGGRPSPFPVLRRDSPRLRDPTPAGPDSLWYRDLQGRACVYLPESAPPCYTVVSPASPAGPAEPAVDPAALAASAARRLDLRPGRIAASPSARSKGLTGAASWFWLSPTPGERGVSVSARGERVTVSAEPESVTWRFGDGAAKRAGPGRPYRPGPPPPDAVRHRYETRCLPGDRGRNPYVLGSCRSDGYRVEALLAWRISYRASGPIADAGALPARRAATSIVYPVGEARAFLTEGGSQ